MERSIVALGQVAKIIGDWGETEPAPVAASEGREEMSFIPCQLTLSPFSPKS